MSKRERIIDWAKSLTDEQKMFALVNAVDRMIEMEELDMWDEDDEDGHNSPFWTGSGEKLEENCG